MVATVKIGNTSVTVVGKPEEIAELVRIAEKSGKTPEPTSTKSLPIKPCDDRYSHGAHSWDQGWCRGFAFDRT